MNRMRRMWAGGSIAILLLPFIVSAQTDIPLLNSLIPPETVRTFESLNQGVNTFFELRDATRDALQAPYIQESRRAAEEYGRRGMSVLEEWDRNAQLAPDRLDAQAWSVFKSRFLELKRSILALPGEIWRDAWALWGRFEEACKGKHILCVL